jgi:hypothetical protein
MLLSTFELLVNPIAMSAPAVVTSPKGSLIQEYFLTIANPNPIDLQIRLKFNATNPADQGFSGLIIANTLEADQFSQLSDNGIYEFNLPTLETGMVIFQPRISDSAATYPSEAIEVRGYVEIFVVRRFPIFGFPNLYPLLVTPEHRGRVLPFTARDGEHDAVVYTLPTSHGGSLMNVETIIESGVLETLTTVPGIPALISRPRSDRRRCAESLLEKEFKAIPSQPSCGP